METLTCKHAPRRHVESPQQKAFNNMCQRMKKQIEIDENLQRINSFQFKVILGNVELV